MSRIVWSPKSLRDLAAIEGYVAQSNPTAAKRLIQKIIRRTDRRANSHLIVQASLAANDK